MNKIDEIQLLLEKGGPVRFGFASYVSTFVNYWDKEMIYYDDCFMDDYLWHLTSLWSGAGESAARLRVLTGRELGHNNVDRRHEATFAFTAEDLESVDVVEYWHPYPAGTIENGSIHRPVKGVPAIIYLNFRKLLFGNIYRVSPFSCMPYIGEYATRQILVWASSKYIAEQVKGLLITWQAAATTPQGRFVDESSHMEAKPVEAPAPEPIQAPGSIRRN